jgi:TPP-dependent 2-oxoacid decarboxylase
MQQNRERTPVHMYVCMDYVDNPTTLKNLQISKSVGDSDMARRMIEIRKITIYWQRHILTRDCLCTAFQVQKFTNPFALSLCHA